MLNDSKDMPKIQIITDEKSIEKYGETECIPLNKTKPILQIRLQRGSAGLA